MTGMVSVEAMNATPCSLFRPGCALFNDRTAERGGPDGRKKSAMTFGILALTVAALFTGAALYVSFVEHPARALLDDRAQLEEWKPAYARGAVMQASLAAVGFGLGAAAWWMTDDLRWLVGGLILLAGWPYTLLFI